MRGLTINGRELTIIDRALVDEKYSYTDIATALGKAPKAQSIAASDAESEERTERNPIQAKEDRI